VHCGRVEIGLKKRERKGGGGVKERGFRLQHEKIRAEFTKWGKPPWQGGWVCTSGHWEGPNQDGGVAPKRRADEKNGGTDVISGVRSDGQQGYRGPLLPSSGAGYETGEPGFTNPHAERKNRHMSSVGRPPGAKARVRRKNRLRRRNGRSKGRVPGVRVGERPALGTTSVGPQKGARTRYSSAKWEKGKGACGPSPRNERKKSQRRRETRGTADSQERDARGRFRGRGQAGKKRDGIVKNLVA